MVSLPLVDLLDILVSSGWGFPGAKKMLKGMGGGLTAVTLEPGVYYGGFCSEEWVRQDKRV